MKKLVVLAGLLTAGCLLGMGTCNLFRDPTSPPPIPTYDCDEYAKREAVDSLASYSGLGWVPDSLLCDSIQYPYVLRSPTRHGVLEQEWVFATANGRWYGQTPAERQWGRYSEWFKVSNRLQLGCVGTDDSVRERGRRLIQENDGFIYKETTYESLDLDTTIYIYYFTFLCADGFYLRSEVPLLELLDRYNHYEEGLFVRFQAMLPPKKY